MATEPRPIRSEADYEAALEEAERLWGAGSGPPEGARLDVLATLIEVHEAKHYPMDPPESAGADWPRDRREGDAAPVSGMRAR